MRDRRPEPELFPAAEETVAPEVGEQHRLLRPPRKVDKRVEPLGEDDVDVHDGHHCSRLGERQDRFQEHRVPVKRPLPDEDSLVVLERRTLPVLEAAVEDVDRLVVSEQPQRIHEGNQADEVLTVANAVKREVCHRPESRAFGSRPKSLVV